MLKIVFTSEDNENSMFGIEEFPISAEHASQLMRGDMCIERFLDDNLNAPDDISRLKGLLLEGNTIDHVTVAIKFESGADIKEAIQKHLANDIWESIYDTLVSSKVKGSLTNCLFLCAEPQLFKNNCMNKVIFKIKCLYL